MKWDIVFLPLISTIFFNQLTVKSHTMDILRLSYCHQGPTQFMIQRHRREERGAGGNFPSTMQTQVKFLVLQYDLRKIKKEISFVYMTFSYNATVTAKYDLICIPKLQYCFVGNSCSYREASKTLKDFFSPFSKTKRFLWQSMTFHIKQEVEINS